MLKHVRYKFQNKFTEAVHKTGQSYSGINITKERQGTRLALKILTSSSNKKT